MRQTLLRAACGAAAALIAIGVGGSRAATDTAAAASGTQIYWGALIQGSLYGLPDPGTDMRAVAAYEAHAGRHVSIIHLGQSWFQNGVAIPFPTAQLENVRLHGSIPLLTWGSTDETASRTAAPAFRSAVVAGGAYDSFIRSFAVAARDWGHPFFLRFDWEMNGWWYPWGEGTVGTSGQITNGNAPGDYVRMWRHVHDIFDQVGATNVTWVWCINEMSQTTAGVHPPMSQIYPGDAYVDWTSYDAYNRYDGWESFNTMSTGSGTTWLLNTYQSLLAIAPTKPMMLAEFGSKEDLSSPQRKPDWLTDALVTQIPASFPALKAIVYYNRNTDGNVATDPDATVAIESSQQSESAFAAGINSGYYASNTFANLPSGRIQPLQQTVSAGPPGPAALTATAGARTVALQWSTPAANGATLTGYRVYRGTAAGAETLLATVGVVNAYLDAEVDVGRTYVYTVAAVAGGTAGPPSNEQAAAANGAGLIASDRFDRTVQGGLGTADVGGAWNVSAPARTAVANGEAVVSGWSGGNQDVTATSAASATNVEVLAQVRLSPGDPVGAAYSPRVVVRAQQADPRNGYTARITHTTAGGVGWLVSRIDNAGGAGSVALASGTLAQSGAAGSRWWIRLRAEGTTIRARFWRFGEAEPAAWTASAADGYWTAGRVGFAVYAGFGLASPYPDTGFAAFDAVTLAAAAGPTVPAAPRLTGATGGNGAVSITWSAPASDGGSAISGYAVYRGTTAGGESLLATVGTVSTYADTSVTNGTTYYYAVAATNAVGTGPRSNELWATPQAAPATTLARDTFERSVAGGFGVADLGGAWAVSSTTKTKVESGTGVVYGCTGANQDVRASLPLARADTDTLVKVTLAGTPTGGNYQVRVVARAQADPRDGYAARIIHQPGGAVTWGLSRFVNAGGTNTLTLGSGTLLSSGGAGTAWWIRLRAQGTSISAKFWRDGGTEPTAWTVTASDGYWSSGAPSLGVYVGSITSGFPSVAFDNFSVSAAAQ